MIFTFEPLQPLHLQRRGTLHALRSSTRGSCWDAQPPDVKVINLFIESDQKEMPRFYILCASCIFAFFLVPLRILQKSWGVKTTCF